MISAIKASPNFKWWAFGVIGIGTFLSVVDHGSVLVALPNIERHFGSDLPTVQWIVVGYALAISVLILPMGRLGDIIGRTRAHRNSLPSLIPATDIHAEKGTIFGATCRTLVPRLSQSSDRDSHRQREREGRRHETHRFQGPYLVLFKRTAILPQGDFILCGTIHIMKYRSRYTPFRQLTEICD